MPTKTLNNEKMPNSIYYMANRPFPRSQALKMSLENRLLQEFWYSTGY